MTHEEFKRRLIKRVKKFSWLIPTKMAGETFTFQEWTREFVSFLEHNYDSNGKKLKPRKRNGCSRVQKIVGEESK